MNPQPNHQEHNPMEEETLDVKKYIFLIISNWYWFALSIFVGLFIGYLVNRYSVNVYSIQSSLIIKDDDNSKGFTGAENLIQGLKLVRNTKSVQNEIGVLKSYSLAHKVLSQLDEFNINYVGVGRRGVVKRELYTASPFKVFLDSTKENLQGYPVNVTILSKNRYLLEIDGKFDIKKEMKWGEPFNSESFNFTIKLRNTLQINNYASGSNFYFILNSLNSQANEYKNKVSIDLNDKKGSILIMTTKGFVPEQEADYLNTLMQTYIQMGLDDKNMIAENTIRFIDSQLAEMTDSLRRAEQKLQDFRSSNMVINISKEGTVIYENVQKLQVEKATAELKNRYYAYLKKYLDDKTDLKDIVAPSAMGIEDVQLAEILSKLSQAYLEQETLKLSANPLTPGLNIISFKLETLKKTLDEKVRSLTDVNKVMLNEIDRRMADFEQEMSKIPYTERLLIGFEREFNLINKMYTYLNEKRAEAAIAKASNIADNKILDYALPQNATIVKPNRRMVTIYGFLAGAMIPFLIIVLIGYFNTTITDIKEIQNHTTVPILGLIGHNGYETELPVGLNPKSTLAESFRGLRTNLGYILRESDKKVITVTSTISGEGKTFIAANLAAIIATTNKKVLIVGLDLRKPKLQNIFGVNTQKGLSTFLIGRDSADDIVVPTDVENLWYAPSGPIPPNPSELIGCPKMDEFISWAKAKFDYIILDTPPVAIVTDALLTQRFTDVTLFVIRFKYSSKDVLKFVNSLNITDEKSNMGIIINDLEHKRIYGYSYGYGYTYGYSYSSGYGYYNDKNGYYTDDEQPLTWKDRIKRLF